MSAIKFKFKSSITEQDLKKEEGKGGGQKKFFDPGMYDLQVINADLHKTEANPTGMSKNDPTWAVVKVTLGGIDDRRIDHYLLVPTVSELYKKPGIKNPRIMFIKFREFVRSLGVDASVDNMARVLNDNFSDLSALVGQTVTVRIGHEGPHLDHNSESKTFTIVDKNGKVLFDNQFADRDSAIVFAAENGLELKPFTKVVEFKAREVRQEKKAPTLVELEW